MDLGSLETIGASMAPTEQSTAVAVGTRRAEAINSVDLPMTRVQAALVGLLLVAAALLYVAGFGTFQVGTYIDDAHYITLARAMAAGKGYSLIGYVDTPPELKFPPGLPLILTPVALLVPTSLDAFKVPSLLLTLASFPFWFVLFRRRLPFTLSFLTLCAVATNPILTGSATLAMSEAPFLFFTAVLLVLADDYRENRRYPLLKCVLVAVVLSALYFVRTVGIVFFAATLVYLLAVRRIRHAMIIAVLFAIPFGAWAYHNATVGQGPVSTQYEQELAGPNTTSTAVVGPARLINRIEQNARAYAIWAIPSYLVLDPGGPQSLNSLRAILEKARVQWLRDVVRVFAFLAVGLGFLRFVRSRVRFAEAALLCYLGALLFWPWSDPRFVQPVGPLVYLLFVAGVEIGLKHLPVATISGQWRRATTPLVICALVLINLAIDIHGLTSPVRNRITDISIGTRWIADHTPPDSIVMGEFVVPQSLYTERKMVEFPTRANVDAASSLDLFDRASVDYVLISPPITTPRRNTLDAVAQKLEQELRAHPEKFQVVFEQPEDNVRVYRVLEK